MLPLLHYMVSGAAEQRDPHPRFDATWYARLHPEAASNPLLHHLLFGAGRGWLTEPVVNIADFLPSTRGPFVCPRDVRADVIVPVYRGLAQTQRCLESVLADADRPPGRIIAVDDHSPEPVLSAWLDRLAVDGRITLLRNSRNLGFVASVNRGMETAGRHDVALLNSDTEVPRGWLRRLAAQAYADQRIASVSPFSNNATICGYPRDSGGPLVLGQTLDALDTICRTVNAGRSVDVPTTVGFCMYIRRAALDDVGSFDAEAFGYGYGEENDFCRRSATCGWRHVLACDTFVYHEGAASFGSRAEKLGARASAVLAERYPDYARLVAEHVSNDAVGPFRFAVTAALFRRMKLPVVLMVSHGLGGGVRRHIDDLTTRLAGRANVLTLDGSSRGVSLYVPALHDRPTLSMPATRVDELVAALQSAAVSRVHIHHLMNIDLDVRALVHRLGVPFDVTVHDYFPICPQVNLLRRPQEHYCGEPGIAACNACIADRPSHGAKEILSWRREHDWLFLEAERVICPSDDARRRLARHGLDTRAIVAPHEQVAAGRWPMRLPPLRGRRLRVAVLGVLAEQKGAQTVVEVVEAADPASFEVHLIGYPENPLPLSVAERIVVSGEYVESELPDLLARAKPHVVWFPGQCPETYSFTLSVAIEAGLPVVAGSIGAFPERLSGRPMSWLVDPRATVSEWLAVFDQVRDALRALPRGPAAERPVVPDFYAVGYLRAPAVQRSDGLIDLRRQGRLSIVVIPERLENGVLSPCAYIRLLQPLNHPDIAGDFDIVLADVTEARRYRADVVATQRYAVPDIATADALAAHCRQTGAALLYDLDDDLLHIPRNHPEASALRPKAKLVQRMLRHADALRVSTPALAEALREHRPDAVVVANGLDERLWADLPLGVRPGRRDRGGPVRLLCMGTATHDADFALVEPALARIKDVYKGDVTIDMLGVNTRADLPEWVSRPAMTHNAIASYPGFVNWITQQPGWDIGLAVLSDTPFNRCKSAIKTFDYAALGMAVLASDVTVYRGSLADGSGGLLVANDTASWFAAISRLLRDPELRRRLASGAVAAFNGSGTLASQAAERKAMWSTLRRKVGTAKRAKERQRAAE